MSFTYAPKFPVEIVSPPIPALSPVKNVEEYSPLEFLTTADYLSIIKIIQKEIKKDSKSKWTMVNVKLLQKHTYAMEEYLGEKFWDDHMESAPAPYKYYIKAGEFIAGELMEQLIGFKKDTDSGEIESLSRGDWERIEDGNQYYNVEYFVVCLEDILECLHGVEPEDMVDCEEMEEWVQYQLETGKAPEGLTDWEMDYLTEKVEMWIEKQADILRGK
jgi:hypothetical protein